jgi:putative transposase
MFKMVLTEVHQIKRTHKLFKFIDDLSFKSKSLYNMANYLIRQEFISSSKLNDQGLAEHSNWLRWMNLDKQLKLDYPDTYNLLPAKSAQMVLKNLDESWKSFFGSLKGSKKDQHKGRINLPKYKDKEKGRNVVILTNQQFRIKDGIIYFLSSLTKELEFKPVKTKIPADAKLIQITISPKKEHYNFGIVYEIPTPELNKTEGLDKKTGEMYDLKENRCMSIDLGINNFCTVANNIDKDFFIINGKQIKSINQWANKFQSFNTIGQRKKNNVWRSRDNKLNYFFNKTSDLFINKALTKGCKTILVGYNQGWKQDVNLGRKTNQSFVQIPYYKFLLKLEYKCKLANIELIKQEESYTSKCSFIDLEEVRKHETYLGKRVKRGLFKTSKNLFINADLNGALNIMKKYLGEEFAKTLNQVEDFVVSPYRISFDF